MSNGNAECIFEKYRISFIKYFERKSTKVNSKAEETALRVRSCFMRIRPAGNAFVTYSYIPKTAHQFLVFLTRKFKYCNTLHFSTKGISFVMRRGGKALVVSKNVTRLGNGSFVVCLCARGKLTTSILSIVSGKAVQEFSGIIIKLTDNDKY
ncbi:hypothetical protein EAG_06690 [Camponotus floridanus]|uniref:Uncharacterized protein n=1 Tax=Camponotus floridanus TaxID=104421 RepID=E2A595_CAMFO|nr:hypothetical protein EAG_06690 [Camponotus floridanus]